MAAHFWYKQLPASGLGHRDPRRAHVTGGLSAGIPIFYTCIGDKRDPLYGVMRDPGTGQRYAVFGIDRLPSYATRGLILVSKRIPPSHLMRSTVETTVIDTVTTYSPTTEQVLSGSGVTDSVGGNDNGILWDDLDDAGPYITHVRTVTGGPGSLVAFDLDTVAEPVPNATYTLVLRERNSLPNQIGEWGHISALLVDASTFTGIVALTNVQGVVDEWVEHKVEITPSEMDLISDYSQLQIWLQFTTQLNPSAWNMDVDYAHLEMSVLSYVTQVRTPVYRLNRDTNFGERSLLTGERTPPIGSRTPVDNDVC